MLPPSLPPDERQRLQALRDLCVLDTPSEERFERIVRTAARLFGVPMALVSLLDEARQWFKARVGLEATETPRDVSFCGHAILSRDTFVVPDAVRDARFHDNPLVLGAPHIRFYAGHPVRAPDGSRVGTLCLLDRVPRDFTDADRAALADLAAWVELEFDAVTVRLARAALAEQEQLKNEFVSTVSHELRTPLTSIRGSLGLLAGGVAGPLTPPVAEMIGIAHKNSERLIRLINDILDLDKMESGKLDLELAPAELTPLLAQAAEAHHGYADGYGVRVETVLDAPGALARVDADRLAQVLANLLSNAIKFSPRGERVTVRLARHRGGLRVSVEDRGPGIPEAFRARLFQKFAQADGSDTRKRSGTGLGLNITRALVERLGGTLDFVTTRGAGTTFWFDLPEWHPEPRAPGLAPARGPAPLQERGVRARVLHVERDADNRRVVADVLRDVAEVVAAVDLGEAESALRAGSFQLVLVEPELPEGGRLSLAPLLAAAPVVLFSMAEPTPELVRQVSASLVKSRASNADLRAAVLQLLPQEAE
ncbi:GAF domain-containing sensor histidine kinase [Pyxidicoccus xibeiensis]|uniref:GAF domain-containing sensor histidine kinase n=1 Tax=Pyxidicoccus xibeiensis TaxID=2906759 RepID=UPI0020A7B91E|nr:GAF domain-containing sensor histidine kinase [Pyxidicoccus xibeiensis]MCP3137278.1 GAF domain-containing sensor histidine kinase [Pyxidicoccus xibeiensis]